MRQEKGLPMMTELLAHGNDRVVRAMSGALRNLAIDPRNRDLLGETNHIIIITVRYSLTMEYQEEIFSDSVSI